MEENRNRKAEEEKEISILYGLPFTPSSLPRLAQIARLFDSSSSSPSSSARKPKSVIGLFVDSPEHIQYLISFLENNNHKTQKENEKEKEKIWPLPIPLYIPIDVGDHREGISISPHSTQLVRIAAILHKYTTKTKQTSNNSNSQNKIILAGFYTHRGGSYSASNPEEALGFMKEELLGLYEGAKMFLGEMERIETGERNGQEEEEQGGGKEAREEKEGKMVLSLGATPTATAIQNLVWEEENENETTEAVRKYRDILKQVQENFEVEFHAGVYPGMSCLFFFLYFLFSYRTSSREFTTDTRRHTHTIVMDMQQLATRARPHQSPISGQSLLSFSDLGFRILVEVASLYFDRGEKPEALIAAGGIVFGREPCKSYPGWGVVTPWPATSGQVYDPEGDRTGWIVGRISQEHGNLTWEGSQDQFRKLELGEKLLVWPNHACIAGVNFGCYLVVDSDQADPDRIQDVWVRWRGW